MKRLFSTLIFSFYFFVGFTQAKQANVEDKRSITYFEKFIIAGNKPIGTNVETKYDNDYRAIIWSDPLIKDYKYSNEAFDKLGYEFVTETEGDNYQSSKTYRNCSKSIIIEVTEWYGVKLSIAMQWYSPRVKKGVGYLAFCE